MKTRTPRYWPSGAPRHEEITPTMLKFFADHPGRVVVPVEPKSWQWGCERGWEQFHDALKHARTSNSQSERARAYWDQYEVHAIGAMGELFVLRWLQNLFPDAELGAGWDTGDLTVGGLEVEVKTNVRGLDLGMTVAQCGVYAERPVVLVVPRFKHEKRMEAILGGWIWGREGLALAHYRTQGRRAYLYIKADRLRPMGDLLSSIHGKLRAEVPG